MEFKERLYTLVERSEVTKEIAVRMNNSFQKKRIKINANSLHFKKNRFCCNSENNVFLCRGNSFVRGTSIVINGEENRITIAENSAIYGEAGRNTIFVTGNHNMIEIGAGCQVNSSSFFIKGSNCRIVLGDQVSAYKTDYHIEGDNGRIEIGKLSTFHGRRNHPIDFTIEEGRAICVGSDCMFSNGIHVRTSDSHSIVDREGKRVNPAEDIHIGSHCWIGMGAYLLKGTVLQDNTVVAAAAVCTKAISEGNCIIGGNPSGIIKRETNWCREQI